QASGHNLPTRIQPGDRVARPMVQDLGSGTRHQTNGARGHRGADQLEPIKWRPLNGTKALRGAVEIRVCTAPGLRIEARHGRFEGGGGYLQALRYLGQRLALWDPRQLRTVARWQAPK